MKTALLTPWLRRMTPCVLGILMLCGALVLLSVVMELQDPAWTRPALGLQLIALVLASIALDMRWLLSSRFVLYPLVLAVVLYLWDTTLPPPSLPEGLLRELVPRLVLVGMVVDVALILHRRGQARSMQRALVATEPGEPPVRVLMRTIRVRQRLLPLDEVAELFAVHPDELRRRLEHLGGVPVPRQGRDHIHLEDFLHILAQWNTTDPHDTTDYTQQ